MLRRTAGRGRAVPAELVSFMVVSPLVVPARPPVRQVMVGEATARPPDRTSDGRAVSGRAEPRRCSGSATLLRQACAERDGGSGEGGVVGPVERAAG